MSRLQFPFTEGLAPPGVNALQQLFAQIERRKVRDAQAKAESERIKAETQRGFGRAAVNIATGGIAGAIKGGVGGAFAGAAGVDPNLFTKRQKNQFDLQNFGIGTEALDTQADAAFGQLFASDARNLVADPTGTRQLGTPLGGQPGPLPSKDDFRGIFRQQLLQQRAQQQAEQQKRAQQQAAQQKQLQKAATEQRIQAWFPDPKLDYEPDIVQEMALVRKQLREDILDPEPGLSQAEQQQSIRHGERRLSELRPMGTKKQEFNIEQHLKKFTTTIPGVGTYVTDPKDGSIKFHQERAKSGDKDTERELQDALGEARDFFENEDLEDLDIVTKEQRIQKRAFETIESARRVREAVRRGVNKQSVLSQRRQAQAGARSAQPLSGIDQSQLNAFRSSISGGGPPGRPQRPQAPPQVAQGAQVPQAPPQQGAQPQQAQKPPHPALAKIASENINQEAIAIIQKAGGTSDPIAIEELKRAGVNRSQFKKSLRVGQIYTSGGNAFVWDGNEFVPLEKPTEKAS